MGKWNAAPEEIQNDYFYWLCSLVYADDPDLSYFTLMRVLFETRFRWVIDNDENRAVDGMDLRAEYWHQSLYSEESFEELKDDPPNVLEVLVALAIRIQDEIMWDPDLGDRTSIWFWDMLSNLGLEEMDDESWQEPQDRMIVMDALNRFMDRNYAYDGSCGGAFPRGENVSEDQRNVELWFQSQGYFVDKFGVPEDRFE